MRADARAKRQDLIAAARRLFAEHGPDVPLTSIAAEAGVGIATLYRNFATRADLLYAIAEELCEQALDTAHRCLATWDDDPRSAWTRFIWDLAELRLSALGSELATGPLLEALPVHAVELRTKAIVAVDEVVARARTAGLARPDATAIRVLLGLAALTRPLPQFPHAPLPDEHEWLIDTYLRGLRADSDDF